MTRGASRPRRRAGRAGGIGALALLLRPLWPAQAQVQLPSAPQLPPEPQLPPAPKLPPAPSLPLQEAPVPVPSLPALPAPPAAPAPVPSAPSVEPPSALPSQAPAAPTAAPPASGSGVTTPGSSASAGAAAAAPGSPSTRPGVARGSRGQRARGRGRGRLYGTRFRSRRRLVRHFQGCLDLLPARQRSALALRYGLGALRPYSVGATARRMGVSRSRVRLLERRGERRLALAGRRTACEDTRIDPKTLTDASGAALMPASVVATGGADAEPPARGEVAGRHASGGSDRIGAQSGRSTLPTPFGADEGPAGVLLIALLAAVLAAIALAGRSLLRSLR